MSVPPYLQASHLANSLILDSGSKMDTEEIDIEDFDTRGKKGSLVYALWAHSDKVVESSRSSRSSSSSSSSHSAFEFDAAAKAVRAPITWICGRLVVCDLSGDQACPKAYDTYVAEEQGVFKMVVERVRLVMTLQRRRKIEPRPIEAVDIGNFPPYKANLLYQLCQCSTSPKSGDFPPVTLQEAEQTVTSGYIKTFGGKDIHCDLSGDQACFREYVQISGLEAFDIAFEIAHMGCLLWLTEPESRPREHKRREWLAGLEMKWMKTIGSLGEYYKDLSPIFEIGPSVDAVGGDEADDWYWPEDEEEEKEEKNDDKN
ncbi:uncharacterized protein BO97DRAFT_424635 [Aspergillus homomorphus CBS 101889]|uniref:Uncharacterized protein n=1 Tax=Aspergillus homomorphus (strain CBS 101889) TaxID=1450537 RepID=A0A395I1W8_ASPHC|nr:hypothetical protein BO97DRAFT_424635 [Aspergillus homomorphus CBS 101889]RAL12554.1 hypothetical protein BO97DRAFT_424635 [Aspergillus homomorphus CBS 101889]